MPDTDRHIVLLVPGLAGPESDHPLADYLEQRPGSLDRLISRSLSGQLAGNDLDDVLFHYFGLDQASPVAPLTYAADTGHAPSRYVMRADPVHLRADQSCLRLFEAHSFGITQDEANALAASFTEFYAERGWCLEAPTPQRWYLTPGEQPDISTTPLANVAGMDINPALPQGGAARQWLAVLNEVQMLFHAHEVNLVREQRGEPAINSLWPWGGGVMPAAVNTMIDRVMTDEPLAAALAGMAGVRVDAAPASAEQLLSQGDSGVTLAVLDTLSWPARYNEIEAWVDALHTLEDVMFAPLQDALATGRVTSIRLLPCNGSCFDITRRQLRGFWRRVRPYEQALG